MIWRHLPPRADFFERPPAPDTPLTEWVVLTDICAGRILSHERLFQIGAHDVDQLGRSLVALTLREVGRL